MEKISNEAELLLTKATSTDTTSLIKFELLTSKFGDKHVYCFVEGYDMQYYISRIRDISGKEAYAIECKGKKMLLQLSILFQFGQNIINIKKHILLIEILTIIQLYPMIFM